MGDFLRKCKCSVNKALDRSFLDNVANIVLLIVAALAAGVRFRPSVAVAAEPDAAIWDRCTPANVAAYPARITSTDRLLAPLSGAYRVLHTEAGYATPVVLRRPFQLARYRRFVLEHEGCR